MSVSALVENVALIGNWVDTVGAFFWLRLTNRLLTFLSTFKNFSASFSTSKIALSWILIRFFAFDIFRPVTNFDFWVKKKTVRAILLIPPDTV